MVNLRIFSLGILAALVGSPAMSMPPSPPPAAPAEVIAAAPQGTHLLAFKTSGDQADADAVAVFETAPDKDGVAHRDLIIFGKRNGKFVPEVTNDKLIACSKCTQFHDDPFYPRHLEVTLGRIRIVQFDSGEKTSETTLDLVRQAGNWHVAKATRKKVEGGWGEVVMENLPIPPSGLAHDMDARWNVPVYLSTLMVNNKNGNFMFLHRDESPEAAWNSVKGDCNKQDCTILAQQQDGCISLVRDALSRSFGGVGADTRDEKPAVSAAMDACSAAGGKLCKPVRTDCTAGISITRAE